MRDLDRLQSAIAGQTSPGGLTHVPDMGGVQSITEPLYSKRNRLGPWDILALSVFATPERKRLDSRALTAATHPWNPIPAPAKHVQTPCFTH